MNEMNKTRTGSGTPEDIERLKQSLDEIRMRRKKNKKYIALLTIALGVPVLVITWYLGILIMGIVLIGAFVSGRKIEDTALTARVRAETESVARIDDIRAIEVLQLAMLEPDGQTRRAAIEALSRMLPKVSESTVGAISPDAIRATEELIHSEDPDLALAALRALRHIGDRMSVAVLRRLANGQDHRECYAEVMAEVPAIRDALKERLDASFKVGLLLRSSGPVADNTLLRPIHNSPTHTPDQLLRPTNGAS